MEADLVVAADVFIYVGALERVVGAVAGMLAEGGMFAFSVETLAGEGDFALRPSRRYAHSKGYVRRILSERGLSILSLEGAVIRRDRGEPVEGQAVVSRKGPSR